MGAASEIVAKVKANATISDIVTDIKPKNLHFNNLQIMHLVGRLFPQRKCYQYYPLGQARKNINHPTFDIQDINKVATTLQTSLFFMPLKSDCSNEKMIREGAKRVECGCTNCPCFQENKKAIYQYLIACLRPDMACA